MTRPLACLCCVVRASLTESDFSCTCRAHFPVLGRACRCDLPVLPRPPVRHDHIAYLIYYTCPTAGTLFSTSVCFDQSITEVFAIHASGGCLVITYSIADGSWMNSAPTALVTTPSVAEALLAARMMPLSVRGVILGGEPVTQRVVDALHATGHVVAVLNSFGPTECTDQCTTALLHVGGRGVAASLGSPIPHVQVSGTLATAIGVCCMAAARTHVHTHTHPHTRARLSPFTRSLCLNQTDSTSHITGVRSRCDASPGAHRRSWSLVCRWSGCRQRVPQPPRRDTSRVCAESIWTRTYVRCCDCPVLFLRAARAHMSAEGRPCSRFKGQPMFWPRPFFSFYY